MKFECPTKNWTWTAEKLKIIQPPPCYKVKNPNHGTRCIVLVGKSQLLKYIYITIIHAPNVFFIDNGEIWFLNVISYCLVQFLLLQHSVSLSYKVTLNASANQYFFIIIIIFIIIILQLLIGGASATTRAVRLAKKRRFS